MYAQITIYADQKINAIFNILYDFYEFPYENNNTIFYDLYNNNTTYFFFFSYTNTFQFVPSILTTAWELKSHIQTKIIFEKKNATNVLSYSDIW